MAHSNRVELKTRDVNFAIQTLKADVSLELQKEFAQACSMAAAFWFQLGIFVKVFVNPQTNEDG